VVLRFEGKQKPLKPSVCFFFYLDFDGTAVVSKCTRKHKPQSHYSLHYTYARPRNYTHRTSFLISTKTKAFACDEEHGVMS
jgi:hypothetical protein